MHPHPIPPIPEETARVARAILPQGNGYLQMRDELGTLYQDEDFRDLFPSRGQPAEVPWRLALVTLMQYAEGLTDRQAADAVRTRIDWKYVLSLELTDSGFDFSVLSEFRGRLLAHGAERRLFDRLLEQFRERGSIKARGKQRTDSTHVLAAIRTLRRRLARVYAETSLPWLAELEAVARSARPGRVTSVHFSESCSQAASCTIKLTLLDQLCQTRVGHQKRRTVLSTATFSLIGKPNGRSVLPGKPVASGGISLLGMGIQACGYGFLSLFIERVFCMIDVHKPPRKCSCCVQMNRPTRPLKKRANARKRQHFACWMPNEQELRAPVRKRCARVRCGERATLAATSSGFRPFSRRQPSMCCGHAPG